MTTRETRFAEYTITEHAGHVEIDVKYTAEAVSSFPTFKVTDTVEEAQAWIEHNHKVNKMMKIILLTLWLCTLRQALDSTTTSTKCAGQKVRRCSLAARSGLTSTSPTSAARKENKKVDRIGK